MCSDKNIYKNRIEELKKLLAIEGVDFYIVPTSDFHSSEYVNEYFKVREYLSGFTGSAGTLVVSQSEAGLWTDGRYFTQAANELEGSGIVLYRMQEENVPTIKEYLKQNVKEGQTIGFDGRVVDARFGIELEEIFQEILQNRDVTIKYEKDIADKLWTDRPQLPCSRLWIVSSESCGMSVSEKLSKVREVMAKENASHLLISKLDDIMWLYNIRANDVTYNPVALSYTFISMETAVIFVQEGALDDEVRAHFDKNGVTVAEYGEVVDYLKECGLDGRVWCDKDNISYMLYKLMEGRAELVTKKNPTEPLKAVKTAKELENLRRAYLRDSVVLTKFLFWMKENVGKVPMDELGVAKKLDAMRAEIPEFLDLSFDTISAYGANAAMAHYSATEGHSEEIKAEGFYLVDLGGQYSGGTTDVTRTIALGDISDEMKKHFTLVACAMLRLANARFLYGCTGRNLDIIARQPLWACDIDYKHGTGHGIGYILNVHEGPHNIRWKYKAGADEAVLEAGMIVSDEPGVYIEGGYGIRTENIVEIINGHKNEYGQFMGFRHLTYVPIDLDAIEKKYMEPSDIKLLNDYHRLVFEKISPYFQGEELDKLRVSTHII
jgi:Xaa-Pro aminopeptidase